MLLPKSIKKFWHFGSPFHLQAALFSIRTFFQVQFLCRSSPANFPPSTIGSADFGIQIYHSPSKSQAIRKFSKTFLAPSYNFLILPRSCSSNPTSLPPNLFWVFAETYHKTYLINSNHVLPP